MAEDKPPDYDSINPRVKMNYTLLQDDDDIEEDYVITVNAASQPRISRGSDSGSTTPEGSEESIVKSARRALQVELFRQNWMENRYGSTASECCVEDPRGTKIIRHMTLKDFINGDDPPHPARVSTEEPDVMHVGEILREHKRTEKRKIGSMMKMSFELRKLAEGACILDRTYKPEPLVSKKSKKSKVAAMKIVSESPSDQAEAQQITSASNNPQPSQPPQPQVIVEDPDPANMSAPKTSEWALQHIRKLQRFARNDDLALRVAKESATEAWVSNIPNSARDSEYPNSEAPKPDDPNSAPNIKAPDSEVPDFEGTTPDNSSFAPDPKTSGSAAPASDAPKSDTPDFDAPNVEASDVEVPDFEAANSNISRSAPDSAAPTSNAPNIEVSDAEADKVEAPNVEALHIEAPNTEAPNTEAPTTEAPNSEIADSETPETAGIMTPNSEASTVHKNES